MSVYTRTIDGWHLVHASPAPTSKLFKCKTCHKTFHTKTARRKHSRSHTAGFKCELENCHRSFRSQDAANQHMKALRHWAPRYKCQTCSQTFPSQTAAEQHITQKRHQTPLPKVVLPAKPSIPSQPEASVPNVADKLVLTLEGDTSSVTVKEGQSGLVESCNYPGLPKPVSLEIVPETTTGTARSFAALIDSDVGVSTNAYNGFWWRCDTCEKRFRTAQLLHAHIGLSAHTEKIFPCPSSIHCVKLFSSLDSLLEHWKAGACKSGGIFDSLERVSNRFDGFGEVWAPKEEVVPLEDWTIFPDPDASDCDSEATVC